MNGMNVQIMYDVAKRQNAEMIAKAHRNQLIQDAKHGNGHVGPGRVTRQFCGALVIRIGEWIHGDRPMATAGALESAGGTLRIAR